MATAQQIADTTRREGFRAEVYPDDLGNPTQGFGQHDGVKFGDPPTTREKAMQRLGVSLDSAERDARALIGPAFDKLDQVRREAVIDLVFNMGSARLAQFVKFLDAIRRLEFQGAAFQLLTNSNGSLTPYALQTKQRAIEIALRIGTGLILPWQRVDQ